MGLNFISANPATAAFRAGQEADRATRLNDLRIDQGEAELAAADRKRKTDEAADQAVRTYLRSVGQGGGTATVAAPSPAAAVPTSLPASGGTGLRAAGRPYAERIVGAENASGNPAARNPSSTAMGDGQFLESTWLETIQKHAPGVVAAVAGPGADVANPEVRKAILDLRADPQLSRTMIDAYGADNKAWLASQGLPATDGAASLAHFAGPGGAKALLTAPAGTPVERLLSPDAIKANPFLAGKTAGQVVAWAEGRIGADGQPVVEGGGDAPPAAAPVATRQSTGLRSTALQRGLAGALANVPGAGTRAAEMLLAAATNEEKMALTGLQLAKTDPQAAIAYFTQMGDPPPPQFASQLANRAAVEQEIQQVELRIKQRTANQPYPKQEPTLKEVIGPDGRRVYAPATQAAGMEVPPPQTGTPVKTFDPVTGKTVYSRPTDAYGLQAPPEKGMRIEADGKGGFSITEGPGAGSGSLAKPTVNEIQKEQVNNLARLDRLNVVKQQFRPEFLTLPMQADMAWTNFKDRVFGSLPPDQAKALNDFESFRGNAFNELTQTLRAMSGAAVTPQEAERLLLAIGDPSQDGPTKFQAKLDQTISAVRRANARLNYIAANGLDPKTFGGIGLDTIPAIIDRRGAELEAAARQANPQADAAAIQAQVIAGLRKEFGI